MVRICDYSWRSLDLSSREGIGCAPISGRSRMTVVLRAVFCEVCVDLLLGMHPYEDLSLVGVHSKERVECTLMRTLEPRL